MTEICPFRLFTRASILGVDFSSIAVVSEMKGFWLKAYSNERAISEHRPEKSFFGRSFLVRGRLADAHGAGECSATLADHLGWPSGIGPLPLSLGKVFLPGRGLNVNELPDAGEDVQTVQFIFRQFPGQDLRPFLRGVAHFDEDQISTQQFTTTAVDPDLIIREALIADLDFQLPGNAFQLLEKRCCAEV
jgi:hypothetical protein